MRQLGLKILVFIVFIPFAMLVAGVFGALHDQISYSVSSEYFTHFKFIQFRLIDNDLPERLLAAIVGWRATWWMGIPLGFFCGLAGFMQRSPWLMLKALLWSALIVMVVTLLVALAGLCYGYVEYSSAQDMVLSSSLCQPLWAGEIRPMAAPGPICNIRFPKLFYYVGCMHNAAYLGGFLSIIVVWLFQWRYRQRFATV